MAATGRRSFLALIGAALTAETLTAETRDELREVVADMATSLSAGNYSAFFKRVDKAMAGRDEMRRQVEGLTAYAELSSSIEVQSNTGDEQKQTAKLDWYLRIKPRDEQAVSVQKRESLTFDFVKRGKQWIVTGIEPRDFFNTP